jgi:uncharacterized lipoprotein YmbA
MRSTLYVSVVLLLLGGCASTPKVDYFTLAMDPSGQARPAHNLVVERFRTTEALGRDQILIQTSATEIEYYASDQWAGSLGELVQQKLAVEFGPPIEDRKALVVSGTILACEQVDLPNGAEARLKLRVVVRDAEKKRYEEPLLSKTYSATRQVSRPSADAVVVALSRCIEQVAAEIAGDVSGL